MSESEVIIPKVISKEGLLKDINHLYDRILKLEEKFELQEKIKDSLVYLVSERMKQLEVINKSISINYQSLIDSYKKVQYQLERVANASQIIECGFTATEIQNMSSEEYYSKVLKPLGVRDARDSNS